MNRAEWDAYAATVPLTANQLGAIQGHCERLGLLDRAERLAVLAELADLGHLGSTADLTLGQAGKLIGTLRSLSSPADLVALTGRSSSKPAVVILGEAATAIMSALGRDQDARQGQVHPARLN